MKILITILVLFILLFLFVGGAVALGRYQFKKNVQFIQNLADTLGLSMSTKNGDMLLYMISRKLPDINGEYQGHMVRISSNHSIRHDNYCYIFFMYLERSLNLELWIHKMGLLSKIGKSIGKAQHIQTGDKVFDADVMIKGYDKMGVLKVLTPDVRMAIKNTLEIDSLIYEFKIKDNAVSLALENDVNNIESFSAVLKAMFQLIQALEVSSK